jgi:hypothetical protein
VSHHRAPTKIKLPNYDGTYYADIFIAQVQGRLSVLNCWEDDELIGHLFSVLNGPARDILSLFSDDKEINVESILKALKAKFGKEMREGEARALLYEVKQRRGQSLKQLALEIEQLMKRAFPMADSRTRDTLMTEAFLQAIYDVDVNCMLGYLNLRILIVQ